VDSAPAGLGSSAPTDRGAKLLSLAGSMMKHAALDLFQRRDTAGCGLPSTHSSPTMPPTLCPRPVSGTIEFDGKPTRCSPS